MQERIQRTLRDAGITIVSQSNTYIESGVSIGKDTVVQPFTFIVAGQTSRRVPDRAVPPASRATASFRNEPRSAANVSPETAAWKAGVNILMQATPTTEGLHRPRPTRLAKKICDHLQIPLGRGRTELFPTGNCT
jgi:hypothetical protein